MSEIRDKATEELRDILTRYGNFMDGYDGEGYVLDIDEAHVAILSHPHIAIVDREAKLPPNPLPNPPDDEGEIISWLGYNEAQRDMLKADFVKEVKE